MLKNMFNGNGLSNDDQLTKDTLRDKIKKFPTNQEFRK